MAEARRRGPARFRQSEVRRAIRAARAEGAHTVEIAPDGRIVIITSGVAAATAPETDEWDEAYP